MKDFLFSGKRRFLTIPVIIIFGSIFLPITILASIGWLVYKKITDKPLKITVLSVIGLLVLFFGSAYYSAFTNPSPPKPTPEIVSEIIQVSPTPIPSPTLITDPNVGYTKVTVVIDGDTIEIESGRRVRLIGVDTPETVDPNRPVGCYGKEASNFTKSQLEGKQIKLEKDVSETDKYSRLLRYVWLGENLFNEQLVKEGYAQVSTYPPDVKYQDKFLTAQTEARNANKGLWSSVCQATPTPRPVTSTPKPTSSSSSCKYSCSGPDKDCSDFSTHAEAQMFFNCCGFSASYDPMRLDKATGQGNGLACESLP